MGLRLRAEGLRLSTKDPQYVVVPQRERLAARAPADGTE